jgi:hypothetical protein
LASAFCAVPEKAQSQIQQVGALLGFGAENDVAFFHAQHVLGLHAEVADAEFGTGFLEHVPHGLHVG